jgi:protein with PEP-CTERM/exosortase system signal
MGEYNAKTGAAIKPSFITGLCGGSISLTITPGSQPGVPDTGSTILLLGLAVFGLGLLRASNQWA